MGVQGSCRSQRQTKDILHRENTFQVCQDLWLIAFITISEMLAELQFGLRAVLGTCTKFDTAEKLHSSLGRNSRGVM